MKKWRKRIKNNKGFVSVAARHNQNRERLVNRSQQREKSCFCVNAPQALIYLQAAGPFPVSGILRNCIEWRDNEMHLKRPENCKKQKKKSKLGETQRIGRKVRDHWIYRKRYLKLVVCVFIESALLRIAGADEFWPCHLIERLGKIRSCLRIENLRLKQALQPKLANQ